MARDLPEESLKIELWANWDGDPDPAGIDLLRLLNASVTGHIMTALPNRTEHPIGSIVCNGVVCLRR